MNPSDEINKIQNNIVRLETLKRNGLMPADLADASILALRKQLAMYEWLGSIKKIYKETE